MELKTKNLARPIVKSRKRIHSQEGAEANFLPRTQHISPPFPLPRIVYDFITASPVSGSARWWIQHSKSRAREANAGLTVRTIREP
jgi:hypothetical protein